MRALVPERRDFPAVVDATQDECFVAELDKISCVIASVDEPVPRLHLVFLPLCRIEMKPDEPAPHAHKDSAG